MVGEKRANRPIKNLIRIKRIRHFSRCILYHRAIDMSLFQYPSIMLKQR